MAQVVGNEPEPGDIVAVRSTYIVQYVTADAFAYTAPMVVRRKLLGICFRVSWEEVREAILP